MPQPVEYGRGTIVKFQGKEMRVGLRKYDDGFKSDVYQLFELDDVNETRPTYPVVPSSLELVRYKDN